MLSRIVRLTGGIKLNKSKLVFQPVNYFIDKNDTTRFTNAYQGQQPLPAETRFVNSTLELNEIKARTIKVLTEFPEVNIKKLDWEAKFKDIGLDSLNRVAFLSCVEHEFNVIFPDNLFDHIENLQQVCVQVGQNQKAF